MKTYWRVEVQLHAFFGLGNRWRRGVSYPQGKSPCYPLDRRLGRPQRLSGHGGEEKKFHPLPGLETPIIQPVAQRYTTELPRFLKISIKQNFYTPETV
jgi:hypothetical protein